MRMSPVVLLAAVLALGSPLSAQTSNYVTDRAAAMKLMSADQYEQALAAFQALAEKSTTDSQKADASDMASRCAVRLKKLDLALDLARRIPNNVPMSKTAIVRAQAAQRDWAGVVATLKDEDPTQWPPSLAGESLLWRGRAHQTLEQGRLAADDLAKAAELLSEHNAKANALLALGSVQRHLLKDNAAALAALQQVHTATNNINRQADAAVASAEIHLQQKQPQDAVREIERINVDQIKNASQQVDVLVMTARCLTEAGQKDAAVAAYQKALEIKGISEARRKEAEAAIASLTATKK